MTVTHGLLRGGSDRSWPHREPPVIDGTLIDATKAKELTDNRGTD
jgi:hypothetical protein